MSLTTSVSAMGFLIEMMFSLRVIKHFKAGHMINRILHLLSFHIKFMKLADGSFHRTLYVFFVEKV